MNKQLLYTMIDDSENMAVNGEISISDYNQIYWNLHELNKTGKTRTTCEHVKDFFKSYGFKIGMTSIGYTIGG